MPGGAKGGPGRGVEIAGEVPREPEIGAGCTTAAQATDSERLLHGGAAMGRWCFLFVWEAVSCPPSFSVEPLPRVWRGPATAHRESVLRPLVRW